MKLIAKIENNHGESLPGSVLLRGPSVGMMVSISMRLPIRLVCDSCSNWMKS